MGPTNNQDNNYSNKLIVDSNEKVLGKEKLVKIEQSITTSNECLKPEQKRSNEEKVCEFTVCDIIGEFGLYQFCLVLITFIRYVGLAMITNTGPLITPDVDFWCDIHSNLTNLNVSKSENVDLNSYLKRKCSYECTEWKYNTSQYGVTLTDTFDLVCDRDWLKSAFQSTISAGVVMAALVWGSVSDLNGRKFTLNVTFVLSFISGLVSFMTEDLIVYTISRSICSFADFGLVLSLSTIIVETLGNKYRGAACILVYTGWACGVMLMPSITDYFQHFKSLTLFTLVIHLLTLPCLMTIDESVRWLVVNERFDEAKLEVKRISRWNNKNFREIGEKIEYLGEKFQLQLKQKENKKIEQDKQLSDLPIGVSSFKKVYQSLFKSIAIIAKLFKSKQLALTTLTLIWVTFNCELLYLLFIIINSDIGNNVKLNYAVGGIIETLATLFAIVIAQKVTRKISVSFNLITISLLCLIFSFTFSHPIYSLYMLNLTKFAISTLSSLVYLVTSEVFPTNLRQTGFGFTCTVGSFGAVVAPFVQKELAETIGVRQVLLILTLTTLSAAPLVLIYLKETQGVELSDNCDSEPSADSTTTTTNTTKSVEKDKQYV